MKRFLKLSLWVIGVAAAFVLFIAFAWVTEWRPKPQEIVYEGDQGDTLPDTITLLSWNIGYAGLGSDMDFFMDGGTKSRTSIEKSEENKEEIARFLAASHADIILLQEVDRDSRRSYGVDQFALFQELLPDYHGYFALNYQSPFVPVPIRAPMGKVSSGMAVFSRFLPMQVTRYQYDSRFSFPVRLFNLKRCRMDAIYRTKQGIHAHIGTTHNTAYDTGNMRSIEMEQLYNGMINNELTVIGGDWNQNPPGYTPTAAEVNDPHFSPQPIPQNADFQYIYDAATPTVRYLNEPLSMGTIKSIIDFFVLSKGMEVLEIRTIDLKFRHSDHNPVLLRVRIGR